MQLKKLILVPKLSAYYSDADRKLRLAELIVQSKQTPIGLSIKAYQDSQSIVTFTPHRRNNVSQF